MSPLLLVAEHITHGIGTDFVFGLRSHGRPENIIPSKGKALALSHVSAMVFMVLALQFCLIRQHAILYTQLFFEISILLGKFMNLIVLSQRAILS